MKTLFSDSSERLTAFVAGAAIAFGAACFIGGLLMLAFFDVAIGMSVSLGGTPLFGAIAPLSIFLLARRLKEEARETMSQCDM